MMTLHLRRCVSLFVCLSLLVSACSPDKSSKAGSKASEFARNTKVDKNSIEKIANHMPLPPENPGASTGNNKSLVDHWKGLSTTSKIVVGAVAVATVVGGVWWLGHKKGWWISDADIIDAVDADVLAKARLLETGYALDIDNPFVLNAEIAFVENERLAKKVGTSSSSLSSSLSSSSFFPSSYSASSGWSDKEALRSYIEYILAESCGSGGGSGGPDAPERRRQDIRQRCGNEWLEKVAVAYDAMRWRMAGRMTICVGG
ncbi:MAG: hypothetical protein LE180_03985 [Endomicrobium sp.]|uniref:hypothetical protein n=1 Tax=Candidatus Endomicrobiellum pyrsonymphae TaxID=1408203 RepID=UPI00357C992C|nr:hypothetical protein [Endomicrobium sp.]